MKRFYVMFVILALSLSVMAQSPRLRPDKWAQPVIGTDLDNFYKVDDHLYRSEQPDDDDMPMLQKFGIHTVLNLRDHHDDENEGTTLTLRRIEMEADDITEEQLTAALQYIQAAPGPVLVHCWHGSDRTGAVVAAYRVVVQKWSKKDAVDELENGGYGYHKHIYPNIIPLIENLDVEKIRKALKESKAKNSQHGGLAT